MFLYLIHIVLSITCIRISSTARGDSGNRSKMKAGQIISNLSGFILSYRKESVNSTHFDQEVDILLTILFSVGNLYVQWIHLPDSIQSHWISELEGCFVTTIGVRQLEVKISPFLLIRLFGEWGLGLRGQINLLIFLDIFCPTPP